jgi:hypothetical protein
MYEMKRWKSIWDFCKFSSFVISIFSWLLTFIKKLSQLNDLNECQKWSQNVSKHDFCSSSLMRLKSHFKIASPSFTFALFYFLLPFLYAIFGQYSTTHLFYFHLYFIGLAWISSISWVEFLYSEYIIFYNTLFYSH